MYLLILFIDSNFLRLLLGSDLSSDNDLWRQHRPAHSCKHNNNTCIGSLPFQFQQHVYYTGVARK